MNDSHMSSEGCCICKNPAELSENRMCLLAQVPKGFEGFFEEGRESIVPAAAGTL